MKYVLLAIALWFGNQARASQLDARAHAQRLADEFEHGKLPDRTVEALENALIVGAEALRDKGYGDLGDSILETWFYREKAFIVTDMRSSPTAKDMGDHDPVEWLKNVWEALDSILGRTMMIEFHLDDIAIFAWSLKPVLFCQDEINVDEYALHFVAHGPAFDSKADDGGFAGSVTYWVVFGACSVGVEFPWSMICNPVAELAEFGMQHFLAPRLNPRMHSLICEGA